MSGHVSILFYIVVVEICWIIKNVLPTEHQYKNLFSCVLEVRPARRTDASALLSAVVAFLPPPCWPQGGENLLHLSPPVKETVQ